MKKLKIILFSSFFLISACTAKAQVSCDPVCSADLRGYIFSNIDTIREIGSNPNEEFPTVKQTLPVIKM